MPSAGTQPAAIPESTPKISLFRTEQQRITTLSLALLFATLALYFPVIHHPFVNYDDPRYVVENPHVSAGLTWQGLKWAVTSFEEGNWHPLTWLSHMLDCELFQLSPVGHHSSNLLLHALNVLALFWVLLQATEAPGRSFMAAGLFALAPLNVEPAAWVSERKTLLSMLFFLFGLAAYRWYVEQPGWKRYATVCGAFALASMAKSQVITFPFVLLLWDYWPLRRITWRGEARSRSLAQLVGEKTPLFLISAGVGVLTVKAQIAGDAVRSLTRYPFSLRLENAVVSYAHYFGKAIWPSRLAVFYPYPTSLPAWQVLAAASLLGVITVLGVRARQQRYVLVGWLWFLGTLVPMIGLVQVGGQAMADRYAYLPLIGCFVMVCWGMADAAQHFHIPASVVSAVSVAILLALAVVSRRQLDYWADNAALWSHALQVTSDNFVAEDGLGGTLLEQGRLEDAIPHFRAAAAIHPADPISNFNIAFYDQQHGDLRNALRRYGKVLRLTNDARMDADSCINMGFIYNSFGDLSHALESFNQATQLRPRSMLAWLGLGVAKQRSGDLAGALQAYGRAQEIHSTDLGYLLRARALEASGQHQDAQAALRAGKSMSQDFDGAGRTVDRLLAP